MDRLAIIADVHGNRWALEAVLADLDAQGLDQAVNLGDSFYGPLDPAATAALLLPRGWLTVRGNQDQLLTEGDHRTNPTLEHTLGNLDGHTLAWLADLPDERTVDGIWLGHGSPGDNARYLLWSITPGGAVRRSPHDVAADLAPIDADLYLCAHDHVPAVFQLPDGGLVVNPGSVGLPAYDDDSPHRYAMQTGSPHARYAIAERCTTGWQVSERAVAYDWQAAAACAEANARPDWAAWLRTGWAR